MKTSKTQQLIEKLKSGEVIVCPKCQKGHIIYKPATEGKFPSVYCSNKDCGAKVIYN